MKQSKRNSQIPFAQISHKLLYERNLSLKAKGLYAFMYSKPDSWKFTIKSMSGQLKEGVDAITAALNELKVFGFVEYQKNADGSGAYFIHFEPNTEKPVLENPKQENPNQAFTNQGKPERISNINQVSNTETVDSTTKENFSGSLFNETELDDKAKTLFKNSAVYDFNIFEKQLKPFEELGADILYYYQAIDDWNKQKKVKRTAEGWIATGQTWMRRDNKANKLKKVNGASKISESELNEMNEYLNNM